MDWPPQPSVLGGDFLGVIWHQQDQRCSSQCHPNYCSTHTQSSFARTSHVRDWLIKVFCFFLYVSKQTHLLFNLSLCLASTLVSLEFEISLCEGARIKKDLSVMLLSNSLIQVFRQNAFIFLLFWTFIPFWKLIHSNTGESPMTGVFCLQETSLKHWQKGFWFQPFIFSALSHGPGTNCG